jgi:NAD(P)-dependent dehydrogenase (short-subunit alcohol dehydrogenase family)
MSQKLNNKVAVITGGTSGIGLAIAKRFAQEGAKVAVTGRNQKSIDQAIAEIGPNGLGIQGDVSKLDDLTRIYQTVAGHFGKIDTLIVNAGVYIWLHWLILPKNNLIRLAISISKGLSFQCKKSCPY